MSVKVVPYNYKGDAIDTTSRSKNWSKGLSPFFLGPCPLYADYVAQNVENAWQYSKVYPEFVGENGLPTNDYFKWAKAGWGSKQAVRYPMGKEVKAVYSYWAGEIMDYITARKKIYIPIYARAVIDTYAFGTLKNIYENDGNIILRDFDGYDHITEGRTLKEVMNDPNRKMGHAFVLAMLLEEVSFLKRRNKI